ncbi:MAG TPA: DNA-processing protein DprA [Edaphocola sp.]|nr:DNA-processing protein DprA [Edaphocola sp.]
MEEIFYQIALTQVNWIGNKSARALLSRFGSAKAIFQAKEPQLARIGGMGKERIKALKKAIDQKRIEKELKFIQRHHIRPLFINDADYPELLKECPDAPVLLYFKGNGRINQKKIIAIVGTRTNTDYGRQMVEELIAGFKGRKDMIIVSGLASGIDAIAHKAALKNSLETIGVLGHGLDRIYPAQNRKLASEMLSDGGLLTEYTTETNADKQNFPQRNRIVAGMSDVIVVAETKEKGGSMITAKLACSYNREVAAFPGRSIDSHSTGCNYLIKTNIARMITHAGDLMEMMNWQPKKEQQRIAQRKLFKSLNPEERKVVDCLDTEKEAHIDELSLKTGLSDSKMAAVLLSLELEEIVRSLPGKRYRLT